MEKILEREEARELKTQVKYLNKANEESELDSRSENGRPGTVQE